ncbi:MAG: hypothetical protein V1712_02965 [Patescibacteria group bacterium]
MFRFKPKSYQLSGSMKWIPNADIFEINGDKMNITEECSLREYEFDSKGEADAFITKHCLEKGMELL